MIYGKVGAADWTVAKLIKIIILVVVLATLLFGIRSGIVPGINQIEGKFDEVILMFKSFGEAEKVCYMSSVSSIIGGDDFLSRIGMSGKDVSVERCSGVCAINGTGIPYYRLSGGNFERLDVSGWAGWKYVISGDIDVAKENWEKYHEALSLVGSISSDSDFLKGEVLTKKFVLFGKQVGLFGGDIIAEWQDGYWFVRTGDRNEGLALTPLKKNDKIIETFGDELEVNDFDGIDEFGWKVYRDEESASFGSDGRRIIYEGKNDNEALSIFYNHVSGGVDDDVYWKIIGRDEPYDEKIERGEVIGMFFSESDFHVNYNAIQAAEHGGDINGLPDGYDPWIRNKVTGSGSTAYGPVQLTMGLAKGYLNGGMVEWTVEERDYLNRFVDQGCMFLLHGGMSSKGVVDSKQLKSTKCASTYSKAGIKEGDKYDSRYDYGGSGYLTSEDDKRLYRQVVIKMMDEIFYRNNMDYDKFWREWRFGVLSMDGEDKRYEDVFSENYKNALKTKEELLKQKDFTSARGDGVNKYSRKMSEENFQALVLKFRQNQEFFYDKVVLSGNDVTLLNDSLKDKSINVGGVNYDASFEKTTRGDVVVFDSGKDKFGLRRDASLSSGDSILGGRGFIFDGNLFILVSFESDGMQSLMGDSNIYRLPEKNFEEVVFASEVRNFLRGVCQ